MTAFNVLQTVDNGQLMVCGRNSDCTALVSISITSRPSDVEKAIQSDELLLRFFQYLFDFQLKKIKNHSLIRKKKINHLKSFFFLHMQTIGFHWIFNYEPEELR